MTPPSSANESALGILAYIPVGFLIVWLQKGKDEFYSTHAKQGAILTAGFILVWILGLILPALTGLLMSAWLLVAATGAVQAYEGKSFNLPLISAWASKVPTPSPAPSAPIPVDTPAQAEMPSDTNAPNTPQQ